VRTGELLLQLLQERVIVQEQLEKAVDYQKENPGTRMVETLTRLGFVDMKTLVGVLAKRRLLSDEQSSPVSPGQETPAEEAPSGLRGAMKLGEILISEKIVTTEQLQKAMEYQKRYPGMLLGKALIDLSFATNKTISNALRRQRREASGAGKTTTESRQSAGGGT
jgi:hypothetical protein